MANVIQEFLVAIGFDVDEQQYKNSTNKFKGIVEGFEKLAKVAGVVAATMGVVSTAVLETANDMEKLYFAAQRAGTSVTGLMELRFGGEQAGLGADQTAAMIERMASTIRSNPGMVAFFRQLHLPISPDMKNNFETMISALRRMDQNGQGLMARMIGQQFGFDETTLTQLFADWPDFLRGEKEQADILAKSGINADQLANHSHEAAENWRKFLLDAQTLTLEFEQHILPTMDRMVVFLTKMIDAVVRLDVATHGWSTSILGVLVALGSVVGGMAAVAGIGSLLGGGAIAGLAGTAAAVAGVAAVGVADAGLAAYSAIQAKKLYDAYSKSGSFDGITNMLKQFEGFSSKIYKDVAGHATIGYGHLVQSGENFAGGISQSQAMQLLAQDLARARDAVLKLVKVGLNQNQLAALTDFTFNLGPGALAGSTLLKDLNAGNFAGAAGQFAAWNRAGGQPNAALTQRRLGERSMFQKPDVSMAQSTNIHVYGTTDPAATGKEVASQQRQVNGDLVRDMGVKVQ